MGSDAASASKTKDIWTIIKDQKNPVTEQPLESYLFFAGSANSGKSSIVSKFLEKGSDETDSDEPTNPSVALEYTFGRRTRGQGGIKDIAHIYELGFTKANP